MIGKNILIFNQATMNEALEEYLNHRSVHQMKIRVDSIKENATDGTFSIATETVITEE